MNLSLTPEEIVKHGVEGWTALARCVILRAVHDYMIGIRRGYIHDGKVTDRLKTALAKNRKMRYASESSVAAYKLEANTAAEDYYTAMTFVNGHALNTMLDLSWKEVKPEYIREKLAREDSSRTEMRGQ